MSSAMSTTATVGHRMRYIANEEKPFLQQMGLFALAVVLYPLWAVACLADALMPTPGMRASDVFRFNVTNDFWAPFHSLIGSSALAANKETRDSRRELVQSLLTLITAGTLAPEQLDECLSHLSDHFVFDSPLFSFRGFAQFQRYWKTVSLLFGCKVVPGFKDGRGDARRRQRQQSSARGRHPKGYQPLAADSGDDLDLDADSGNGKAHIRVAHKQNAVILQYTCQWSLFGVCPSFGMHRTLICEIDAIHESVLSDTAVAVTLEVVRVYELWHGKLFLQLSGVLDYVRWLNAVFAAPILLVLSCVYDLVAPFFSRKASKKSQ